MNSIRTAKSAWAHPGPFPPLTGPHSLLDFTILKKPKSKCLINDPPLGGGDAAFDFLL